MRPGQNRRWVTAQFGASLLLVLSLAAHADAQATLVSGLGGPIGFGAGMLLPDDDEFSVEVDVLPAFPDGLTFFGATFASLWVNTNGNISFGMPIMTWTPRPFPIASQPMIAVWWADVDTLAGPLPEGGNTVYFHVEPGRVVVTWFRVGYWDVHIDHLDSFQLILTPGAGPLGSFDLELRYAQCEWSTADSSGGASGLPMVRTETCVVEADCPNSPGSAGERGYQCVRGVCVGTPAQAGYDAGDLTNFLALPGSRTPEILNLCTLSNLTPPDPGVWRFDDELRTLVAVCGNTFRETGEACDDGNVVPGDGCTATCTVERCGDGVVQPMLGEACDDSGITSGDGCTDRCQFEVDAGGRDGAVLDAGAVDAARVDAGPGELVVSGSGVSCGCHVSRARVPAEVPFALLTLSIALAIRRHRRARRATGP